MISVLVVDDSALVRRLVTAVLDDADGIQVVGTAANGEIALRKVDELKPDLVTLDIEMPVMDGLHAMRELRRRHPRLPVIMFSTLTSSGAAATLEALAAGASDYVTKPTNGVSLTASLAEVRDQLVPRVRALAARGRRLPSLPHAAAVGSVAGAAAGTKAYRATGRTRQTGPLQVVAVGSSTGGPEALSQVLGSLSQRPPVPIVIVQHMPPVFTGMLAQRLDRLGPASVVEAADGQALQPGVVYIAPGGRHLELVRRGALVQTRLHDKDPENYSRPSVDVLFRSVAQVYPGNAIAVVLTGMGHDGRDGAALIGQSGSLVVAQDEPSSVVWGMPGAVTEAGLADTVLPLGGIASYLSGHFNGLGAPVGAAR
jgi:two-component system, chemotaxis family, protein-glutamate methylesterase/glutaminase